MKKSIILLFLAFSSLAINAQELKWYTDVKEASAVSIKTKKPLLLFFTGSDWCGWCMKLQKEVFVQPDFAKWAKENVVLVELDYPKRKQLTPELTKQNNEIGQMFGIRGYPTVWLVNSSNSKDQLAFERLGSTGYVAGGPQKWIEGANAILKK